MMNGLISNHIVESDGIRVHVQLHIHLTSQVPKNKSDIQLEQ